MKIFISLKEELEEQHGIKFDEPTVMVHPNGFISVQVDWHKTRESEDFWKFKYVSEGGSSFGGDCDIEGIHSLYNVRTADFVFQEKITVEDVDYDACFSIVFGTETEEEWLTNDWQYLYFINTKYGILAWFAPQGWEDWENSKPFEQK